ncbi:MAG: aldo/keto reductase [Candidatus Polarisedimenticolaceae bacterium]|nr:aldo/keto reductase [Candidatus Polarisedimenticolaceae bacterium]
MELKPLGNTGINVSPVGLGTVKIGRNQQVKYPSSFQLPDDSAVRNLLAVAHDCGINLIDTAPAYGTSMQRLGQLLPNRSEWVIVSKVGEFFEQGRSRFDFSYGTTIRTVEDSLRTLKRDMLDVVLIHSDGNDLDILENEGAPDALRELKERGLIRSHGLSIKTMKGGLAAVAEMDVVMATCNPAYRDEIPVIEAAKANGCGILIKKGLQSGHTANIEESLAFIFAQPGVASLIVGTINPDHLRQNVMALQQTLSSASSK